ncbi:MAG: peptide ABC transporter substrate-binding protein [Candidatus Sungbacteria bacterium]|nr:peptide ABC transporter substrate-binding protein [Candidatus Sungbacteria bacterium]
MDIIRSWINDALRLQRRWKLLTARKLLYLPHILSRKEKRLLLYIILVIVVAGGGLFIRTYLYFTHPTPAVGGSYTEGVIGAPRSINPLYISRDAERDIAHLVFSGLLGYDGAGEITYDLAERYDISPDGKTYTLYLRQNSLWHDGKPVTADDVVFTVKRLQDPQYKSPFRANWQGVEPEKIDDHTVKFTLRTAYAPFIENLTQGIIPKHLWEEITPDRMLLHELNLNPVGSGPYRLKRFKYDNDGSLLWYTVARNSDYWGDGPYLKEITFVFYAEEDELLNALHRGEIEGFGPISVRNTEDISRDRYAVLTLATPRIFSVFFNQRQSPALADKSVREAIAYALDKSRVVREVGGGAIVTDSLLPPFQGTPSESKTPLPYDQEQARKLLDRAGWKDTDEDGIRDKKIRQNNKLQSVPLRFTLATGDSPELTRAAEAIKAMLADIGIEISVASHSFADLEAGVIRPRSFEMLLFGQVYGYEPDPFTFWHSTQIKDPGLNVALFANKKADQILEEARRTTNTTLRRQKYAAFASLADADIPAIPLYTQLYLYLLPRDINGVEISRMALPSDRFNGIQFWYRDTRRALGRQ